MLLTNKVKNEIKLMENIYWSWCPQYRLIEKLNLGLDLIYITHKTTCTYHCIFFSIILMIVHHLC